MISSEIEDIQARYTEMKIDMRKSSATLHEVGQDIKEKYHIGYPLEGTSRSVLAQFHSCIYRELSLKRCVKSYYIADAITKNNSYFFPSHPELNYELILNEIKALSELNHQNIIRLYDVYVDNKYIHLVTEFCKGRELFDKLYAEAISLEIALSLFIQIIEGINYIHSKGYAHRGLCIENIMFTDYSCKKLKIIGFSGAIKVEGRIRIKYGSPMYMAPEVFHEDYDEKCDI